MPVCVASVRSVGNPIIQGIGVKVIDNNLYFIDFVILCQLCSEFVSILVGVQPA